jgi:hypothetical protein
MYHKPLDKKTALETIPDYCKQEASKFKFADRKDLTLDEHAELLPAQLLRHVFKHKIGHLPYEQQDDGERSFY